MINHQDPKSQIKNVEKARAECPIQKTQKKLDLLQFETLCQNYYRIRNSRRYKFLQLKAKTSLQCGSYRGKKLCEGYGLNLEEVGIFPQDSGGRGKPQLVKTRPYSAISKKNFALLS